MQAASDFARTKTMAEQRRFLPVADCREELLQVVRENQVVVVVGETGSGKTTQVTWSLLVDTLPAHAFVIVIQPSQGFHEPTTAPVLCSFNLAVQLGDQVIYHATTVFKCLPRAIKGMFCNFTLVEISKVIKAAERLWSSDSDDAIPARGWIHTFWANWLYAATARGSHVCC